MKYLKYINEVKISDVNKETLKTLKFNLTDRLEEYKESVLMNIEIKNDEVKYLYFNKLDERIIKRELDNFLSKDFVEEIGVMEFIKEINTILNKKEKTVKKDIKKSFKDYFDKVNKL